MDMKTIKICTVEEVGERLRRAREAQGLEAQEVAARTGIAPSSYGFWEQAKREGGCTKVAQAGAILGLDPNELFLVKEGQQPVELRASSPLVLEEVAEALIKMDALCADADKKPSRIFAEHLRDLLRAMEDVQDTSVPPGTVIERPEKGVKTYSAPKKRKAGVSGENEAVGEEPGKYGKKKK